MAKKPARANPETGIMEWRDEFCTGIEAIDEQHQRLFALVDELKLALQSEDCSSIYQFGLNLLSSYALEHFGLEETCMHVHKCPAAQNNQLAHAQFVQYVTRFQQDFQNEGFSHPVASELVKSLEHWLVNHICRIDVQLRVCPTVLKDLPRASL